MNLEELERLAREAHRDEDLSWWHEHSLRYHLRVLDGTCPESDPPFIAACSPETVLRLVSIAKAAERALPVFEEAAGYVDVPTFSPSMAVECNDALAALRAALIPPGCKPT